MKPIYFILFIAFSMTFSANAQQKEVIHSTEAPNPIGPYSQAIKANGFLFLAGQLGIHPETKKLVNSSFKLEVTQAIENIKAVLTEAGTDMNAIVNTTVFLTDLSQFQEFNEIYAGYFTSQFPARTTVGAGSLPAGASIEIAVIAIAPE